MQFITESLLRKMLADYNGNSKSFYASNKIGFTPAALDFLKSMAVKLVISSSYEGFGFEQNVANELSFSKPINKDSWQTPTVFKNYYTGEQMDKKGEAMTHLYENVLVYKDDPRIILRGKLDSLQSFIIDAQISFEEKKRFDLVEALDSLLNFSRNILRAEVLNQELKEELVMGLSYQQIRAQSHSPEDYFAIEQMVLVSYKLGTFVTKLNSLRTYARECELVAVSTFRNGDKLEQASLIEALNRLSSCFHILMYKELCSIQKLRK